VTTETGALVVNVFDPWTYVRQHWREFTLQFQSQVVTVSRHLFNVGDFLGQFVMTIQASPSPLKQVGWLSWDSCKNAGSKVWRY